MLSRYKIYRGKLPAGVKLPDGARQDIRHFRQHALRPEKEVVETFLAAPSDAAWRKLRTAYLKALERRFREERAAFDALAQLAREQNVYLGCNCPTEKNPRLDRCHTWLALQFMQAKYPDLRVVFPEVTAARA